MSETEARLAKRLSMDLDTARQRIERLEAALQTNAVTITNVREWLDDAIRAYPALGAIRPHIHDIEQRTHAALEDKS